MSRDSPVTIVTGANDAFAMPMGVTLYSALVNLDPDRSASVFILDGGISGANRQNLYATLRRARPAVDITWLTPDLSGLDGIPVLVSNAHTSTYLKLLIAELLPARCERAIYLDSDLVVESDLGTLWDRPFDDHLALGVWNYTTPSFGHKGQR